MTTGANFEGSVLKDEAALRAQECRQALRKCAEAAAPFAHPDLVESGAGATGKYQSADRWRQALSLLGELRSVSGGGVDAVSHSAAIAACAAGGRWAEVLQLLADANGPTASSLPPAGAPLSVAPAGLGLGPSRLPASTSSPAAAPSRQRRDEKEELADVSRLLSGIEASLGGCALVWRQALELLAKPKAASLEAMPLASSLGATPSSIDRDVLRISGVVEDTCRQGQWHKAMLLLGDLRRRVPLHNSSREEDTASEIWDPASGAADSDDLCEVDQSSALRAELESQLPSVLMKRAEASGVSEASVTEALDADDTKGALVQLIVAAEEQKVEAPRTGGGKNRPILCTMEAFHKLELMAVKRKISKQADHEKQAGMNISPAAPR